MKHQNSAALTGGIASGKSTVSRMFRELGVCQIDADIIARQVVEPGKPAWKEIVDYFGEEILLEDGTLDRKKLGAVIFKQVGKRHVLNQIVHPRVIQEIDEQERAYHAAQPEGLAVVDVPLLIETAMHEAYETIVLVYLPETIQLQRLIDRDKLSEQDALARVQSQMPLSEKLKYATYVIHNDKSIKETRRQVHEVYRELLKNDKD
ncbi:MAG: dephospho-CoA kinase [bacterium]|nr:dephospho-CoA kinase [bacterium]